MLVSPLALAISAATEEGFLPIFNGTDLSGWQLLPETADPQMEGGTIAGKIHIKPGGLRENRFVKSFPDRCMTNASISRSSGAARKPGLSSRNGKISATDFLQLAFCATTL